MRICIVILLGCLFAYLGCTCDEEDLSEYEYEYEYEDEVEIEVEDENEDEYENEGEYEDEGEIGRWKMNTPRKEELTKKHWGYEYEFLEEPKKTKHSDRNRPGMHHNDNGCTRNQVIHNIKHSKDNLRPKQLWHADKKKIPSQELFRPESTRRFFSFTSPSTWLVPSTYLPFMKQQEEICFNYLGCFNMKSPWNSILRPIPAPGYPEIIAASILFYSRQNSENGVRINLYPRTVMNEGMFDPDKRSVIIIHGFASSGNATWLKDLKDAYLEQVDANVMVVDWGKAAYQGNYLQVAGNTRLVARQLEIFVQELINEFGADPKKFHLIGHSLGAHICSYLAKSVPGFKRLTALDPAQPGFEGFDKRVRLHSSDADFVDVVHTDARPFIPTLGFGMMMPVGDVDFYMNGGFYQPGCLYRPTAKLLAINSTWALANFPVSALSDLASCPHGRSHDYFIEALKRRGECTFWGHKTGFKSVTKTAVNTLTQGLFNNLMAPTDTCSEDKCMPLGLDSDKFPLRGIFIIVTRNSAPFCMSKSKNNPSSFMNKITNTLNPFSYF